MCSHDQWRVQEMRKFLPGRLSQICASSRLRRCSLFKGGTIIADDRRRHLRRKALKGAEISFNLGHSTIDCTIRDMSDGGAKLLVVSTLGIPDEFELAFHDGRLARRCRVAWRQVKSLGVEFLDRQLA